MGANPDSSYKYYYNYAEVVPQDALIPLEGNI